MCMMMWFECVGRGRGLASQSQSQFLEEGEKKNVAERITYVNVIVAEILFNDDTDDIGEGLLLDV